MLVVIFNNQKVTCDVMERRDNLDNERIKILLVDDRADQLVAIESVLKSDQYHLMTAFSGEEALKLILKHEFAVILLDVQMSGMNGFETAQLIKMRERSMHIPIIFITATGKTNEQALERYSAGVIDYIVKPFNPDTLRLKIDGYVEMYKNRHQLWRQNELMWNRTFEIGHALPADVSYGHTITLLESIADALVAVDRDWRFTYVNQEAERRFGISREELIGRSLWSVSTNLLRPDDVYRSLLHAAAAQTPVQFECCTIDEKQWFEIRTYPSESGLSIYFSEVTARKRMELELQRSQQYFRQIFNSSPSLMALCGPDGEFLDVNENWVRNTGYSLVEIRGRSLQVIRIEAEGEDGVTVWCPLKSPSTNRKIHYTTKYGEKRDGLLSTEMLDIHEERHLLCVIADITERVQMDKHIARLGQLNLVGEMAAGIAHEIRNPMTTVRGFLQLSKTGVNREFADIMIQELDRANAIITEFLSLAKNTFSNQKPQKLSAIIEFLFPLMEAEALMLGKRVELQLGDCPELMLDEKEIRQVILNMVKNGLDAMEPGGKVTLRTYADVNAGILEITDQGPGIPDNIMEKIGTPFFTTKDSGTGLGLAVCYSIANRHRATIDVRTGKQGTTFTIRFPLRQEESTLSGE